MKLTVQEVLQKLTLEEKISILTGNGSMSTAKIDRLGIPAKQMADGPHGVRTDYEKNCTSFPCMCLAGATWDTGLVYKLGEALAKECIQNQVDMLLAPGINLKRHILCGRNFEYISEDPVLSGEIAAAYVNGLQSLGVAASVKHFAVNNQEVNRLVTNVDVDIRTLMELYLKAFEIVVTKAAPISIMCAYNKLHSIWCSENHYLLTQVLRDMWGYQGFVVSDWGAVVDFKKSVRAGLDLQMPENDTIQETVKQALKNGELTMEELDTACKRVLSFLLSKRQETVPYHRENQHKLAREIASAGMVLLKNEESVLPITKEKYKRIAVLGEFAKSPIINGQGSAEVKVHEEYVESPYDEMKKILGNDIEMEYQELYKKGEFSNEMLWIQGWDFKNEIADKDLVVFFVGSMVSEDTEQFDRRTAQLNPNYELFIQYAVEIGKKVVVVLQSGAAMILGDWRNRVQGIVQMW